MELGENEGYDERTIRRVWEKGIIIESMNPEWWRKDHKSNFIKRNDYKNFESPWGWIIIKIDITKENEIHNLLPIYFEAVNK